MTKQICTKCQASLPESVFGKRTINGRIYSQPQCSVCRNMKQLTTDRATVMIQYRRFFPLDTRYKHRTWNRMIERLLERGCKLTDAAQEKYQAQQ